MFNGMNHAGRADEQEQAMRGCSQRQRGSAADCRIALTNHFDELERADLASAVAGFARRCTPRGEMAWACPSGVRCSVRLSATEVTEQDEATRAVGADGGEMRKGG